MRQALVYIQNMVYLNSVKPKSNEVQIKDDAPSKRV